MCPLGHISARSGEFTPVGAEEHPDDQILVIGEAPGQHEVLEGRPFVGPSGIELQAALDKLEVPRGTLCIDNVISCRPPKNDMDGLLRRLSRQNKKRAREKKSRLLTPLECCRPRLLASIAKFDKIICLGATAAAAIRGGNPSILKLRGACEEVNGKKVAYTLHPAHVLRFPRWRRVFHHDLAKAMRYFNGALRWKDPQILIARTPQEVADGWLRLIQRGEPVAYDVETDGIDPLSARLRCVGFSNTHIALIVPLLSISGQPYFSDERELVLDLLREILSDPKVPLVGHNAGQFDRLICEARLGVTPKLAADTILLHLLADNEMPHNLGFIGSFYTDFTEAWKADHTATQAKTDTELFVYCAKDACVTMHVATELARAVQKRDQWHLIAREHTLQRAGVNMERVGMRIDLPKVEEKEREVEKKLKEQKRIIREGISEEFNPRSTMQLRRLLFDDWGLPPVKYNEKTGDPSTDDDTLRRMITGYGLHGDRIELLQAVRLIRRYSKLLGTYLRPLRPNIETYTTGSGEDRPGIILSDGRVHPSYNRLPATGRYSSSNPNAQNIPYLLRDLFIPAPGCVFVGADMDQLELRLVAEESNAERLLASFNSGNDPHNQTMEIVYGKGIWMLEGAPKDHNKKGKGVFKNVRGLTKNVRYAWQYGAGAARIHEQVISAEDDNGKLIYADKTVRDIRSIVKGLAKADPEIPAWWKSVIATFRRQGFISDPLWGRRRDFLDEEKLTELANHPIQAGGAAIVHEAMIELLHGKQPWFMTEGSCHTNSEVLSLSKLVTQTHDSLVFEVPEEHAEAAREVLTGVMTRRRKTGAKLTYTAEADVGVSWAEV